MSIFEDDGPIFNDPAFGAEMVTIYIDIADDSTKREGIIAQIVRRPPRHNPADRSTLDKQLQLRFDNSATTGILATEIVFGRSGVKCSPDRRGGELQTLKFQLPDDGLPWHDEGMVRLFAR